MDFMIFDSNGNAVDAFDSERSAVLGLLSLCEQEPELARHLSLGAFGDDGQAVGEALTLADLDPYLVTTLAVTGTWTHDWEEGAVTRPSPSLVQLA